MRITFSAFLRGLIGSWPWCAASCACCKQQFDPMSFPSNSVLPKLANYSAERACFCRKKLAETEPHVISARTLPSKKFKCFKFGIWHHCAAFDLEQCCQIATHKQTTVKNDSEHWIRWDSSWEYCRPCEIWRGTRRWWSPSGQRTSRTMSRWCSPARTRARTASRRSTPPASCSTRPMEACISEIHQR